MFWATMYFILPHPRRDRHKFSLYRHWFFSYLEPRVIAWHKKSLYALDQGFRMDQEQKDLLKKRLEYLARGGDPMDWEYPSIEIEDLP